MTRSNDAEEEEGLRICSGCIGEQFLSNEVETEGSEGRCSYCEEDGRCFSIKKLADRIETAFSEHYIRTSDQPNSFQSMMLADKESSYEWDREGEPVLYAIMNAAYIPESAAANISEILEDRHYDHELAEMGEESEFSSDSYYEEAVASDARWQEEWRAFERSLKEEARFFSSSALALLREVFSDIESLRARGGRSPIVEAGPGTDLSSLFRARAFQSGESLKAALARPDLHLGSPPTGLAKAGRMNAQGISVFYGSNDATAALAEVRPPVGSKVATARFEILRPVRLLDLTALAVVANRGSVFDPRSKSLFERTAFLRTLSELITVPVMPDNEAADFLATQAIVASHQVEAT